jgi:hypothetical protein
MKVPIKVTSVEENPDGSAKINIEFDEDVKRVLMKAWEITEWDDDRAQREFIGVIRESLSREETKSGAP